VRIEFQRMIDLTRDEELRAVFFPIFHNYDEWKAHPEQFTPGTNMDRVLVEHKKGMKVSAREWMALRAEWAAR
jgi:hypothetical protein